MPILSTIRLSGPGASVMRMAAARRTPTPRSSRSGTVSGPDKNSRGSLIELTWRGTEPLKLPSGEERHVFCGGRHCRLLVVDTLAHAGEEEVHAGHLTAPMAGTVVAVSVKTGERVARGAPLMILEAMKMEHTITAPAPGIVTAVNFGVGDRVAEGADLVAIDDE